MKRRAILRVIFAMLLLSVTMTLVVMAQEAPEKDPEQEEREKKCMERYVTPYEDFVLEFGGYATIIAYSISTALSVISILVLLIVFLKLLSIRIIKWRQAWIRRVRANRHATVVALGDEADMSAEGVPSLDQDQDELAQVPPHLRHVKKDQDQGNDLVHHTIQCLIVINLLFVTTLLVFYIVYHVSGQKEENIPLSIVFSTLFLLSCYWSVVIILSLYFNVRQFAAQSGMMNSKRRKRPMSRTDRLLMTIMAHPIHLRVVLHVFNIALALFNVGIRVLSFNLSTIANGNLQLFTTLLIIHDLGNMLFYVLIVSVILFIAVQLFLLLRRILNHTYLQNEASKKLRRLKLFKTAFQLFMYFFSNIFLVALIVNRATFSFNITFLVIQCGPIFTLQNVYNNILVMPFFISSTFAYIILPLKPMYDIIVFMFINKWFSQQLREILKIFCLDTGEWTMAHSDDDDDDDDDNVNENFGPGDLQQHLLELEYEAESNDDGLDQF